MPSVKSRIDHPQYVLDTSAVIALLRQEHGWEVVQGVLEHSVICAVNLTETITKLIHRGGEPRMVEHYLKGLALEVLPWDEALAWESRDLCPLTWTHGISFADRACLALARSRRLTAVTSDAAWRRLGLDVRILLFREGRTK